MHKLSSTNSRPFSRIRIAAAVLSLGLLPMTACPVGAAHGQRPSQWDTQSGSFFMSGERPGHVQLEGNGIVVGQPKLFDQRSLDQLLQTLQASLAATQVVDPGALKAAMGRVQGGTAETSSATLNITGPALPGVASTTTSGGTAGTSGTTANTATSGTSSTAGGAGTSSTTGSMGNGAAGTSGSTGTGTTGGANSSAAGPTVSINAGGITIQVNGGGTSSGTTNPNKGSGNPGSSTTPATTPTNPTSTTATPTVPTLTNPSSYYTYQPTFGESAQDLLAEQTSLSYQIINLQLLLEESLSDRLVGLVHQTGSRQSTFDPKPRAQAVVGFQISIDPKLCEVMSRSV